MNIIIIALAVLILVVLILLAVLQIRQSRKPKIRMGDAEYRQAMSERNEAKRKEAEDERNG